MSNWTKNPIAKIFLILDENSFHYIILIAANVYGMEIDNPNVKLDISDNISFFFNAIIQ